MEKTDSPRFAALQHRDFRLLWSGQLLSTMGTQMQRIALNWHIFELLAGHTFTWQFWGRSWEMDGQALGLGSLGLARVLPIFLFALLSGMMADHFDRRRILIITQSGSALVAMLLTFITLSGQISLPWLYGLTAAATIMYTLDEPALQSLVPNLVPEKDLTSAVSLNTTLWYFGTIVGPGLAGWLVAQYDVGLVYGLNSLSFLAVVVALFQLKYRGRRAPELRFEWAAVAEGIRFTYRNKLVWSTMLLDFWATFFGSARTMLPIVADRILNVGVVGYGWLATAQPVGAVITGLILSWRSHIRRQGVVLLISVAIYGLATALFGLATSFALAYLFFALTGAGDTVSTVIRGTIRQLVTPDRLRGRMTSINMMFFMGGPQLGELEAGLIAAVYGAPMAIVSGGLAVMGITAWIGWRFGELRRYEQ